MNRLENQMSGVSHANHHQNDNLSQSDVEALVQLDNEIKEWESKDNNFERAERLMQMRQQRTAILFGKPQIRKGDF
jgi:hypothetical protein